VSFRAILPHEEYEAYAEARRTYELVERAKQAGMNATNTPRAQRLIRSVENILWNYTHSGAVTPEDVVESFLRAYTDSYGAVPIGSNATK